MKGIIAVSGIVLAAAAATALVSTSRLAPAPRERPLRLISAPRPKAERATRWHCVRLGWKAPYWYAGVSRNGISTQSTQRIPL
jgi:hypothetical protein